MKDIVIIGNGGHSKVIQDIVAVNKGMKVSAILDDQFSAWETIHSVKAGPVHFAESLLQDDHHYFIIGIGSNKIRREIVKRLSLPEDRYISLVHSTAVISSSARIGRGTVVMANAVINADTKIGKHSIVNTGAIVEHDTWIEDYVHISPGAILTGNVRIGEGTHVGAGAVIIPQCSIGNWCMVGAGSAVIQSVPDFKTAVGSPARLLDNSNYLSVPG